MNFVERYKRNMAIVESYNAGATVKQLAGRFGMTDVAVRTVLRQAAESGLEIVKRDDRNGAALAERNRGVVEMLAQGATYQSVGATFGITRQRVHQIVKRSMTEKAGQ